VIAPEQFSLGRTTLTQRLLTALVTMFRGLGSWREPDADRFVGQAVPLVQGAQRALGGLTAAYVASQASLALGRPVAPPGVREAAMVNLRAGVTPFQVYRRPFVTLYRWLSEGLRFPEALERAENRLEQIGGFDLQQTYAEAARDAMRQLPADSAPSGWRRVLVGEENCALCVVASTQRYTVADLNPLHANCDCRVEPVFGETDQVLEPELADTVKAAVAELTGEEISLRGTDLRRLLVSMTPEHGELGPVLVRPRDHFTTAAELPL
jgi:hypothetical protein